MASSFQTRRLEGEDEPESSDVVGESIASPTARMATSLEPQSFFVVEPSFLPFDVGVALASLASASALSRASASARARVFESAPRAAMRRRMLVRLWGCLRSSGVERRGRIR